jgi:outer membrane murein-binding lipoprotein Lpp
MNVKITIALVILGAVLCGCQTQEEQIEWQNQKQIRDTEQVQQKLNDQAAQLNNENNRTDQQ